jgi:hypothetical protein
MSNKVVVPDSVFDSPDPYAHLFSAGGAGVGALPRTVAMQRAIVAPADVQVETSCTTTAVVSGLLGALAGAAGMWFVSDAQKKKAEEAASQGWSRTKKAAQGAREGWNG